MAACLIRDYQHCPEAARGAVIAIGNFDGLHRGHQEVIRQAREIAHAKGVPCSVMSFYPHPRHFFTPKAPTIRLMRLRDKWQRLQALGVDILYLIHFNRRFASLSAEAFTSEVLHTSLQARHVVTGTDFMYGHQRQGNSETLERDCRAAGIGFTAVAPVMEEGVRFSSSAIRQALQAGEIDTVQRLLGHPFVMTGRVRSGDKRGRLLGFPTANLDLQRLCTPAYGVYAVSATLAPGTSAERTLPAVANLGIRPTFGSETPMLEVHVMDYEGDLYGQLMRVTFHTRLRAEQKFDGMQALVAQIRKDVAQTRQFFSEQTYG